MRYTPNPYYDERRFRRTALSTKLINQSISVPRGGIRL